MTRGPKPAGSTLKMTPTLVNIVPPFEGNCHWPASHPVGLLYLPGARGQGPANAP